MKNAKGFTMDMDAVIDVVDWYREIYREDPTSHAVIDYMRFLYEDGEWEELFSISENRLKQNPRCSIAKAYKGLAAWKLGKPEVAHNTLLEMHRSLHFLKDVYEALASLEKSLGNSNSADYFDKIASAMSGGTITKEIRPFPVVEEIEKIDAPKEKVAEERPLPTTLIFCKKALLKINEKLSSPEKPKGRPTIFDSELRKLIKEFLAHSLTSSQV